MARIFRFALAVVAVGVAAPTGAHCDLIVNGGAESGSLTGWSTTATPAESHPVFPAQFGSQTTGSVEPHSGDWFFAFTQERASSASMFQTGAIPENALSLTLDGFVQTEGFADSQFTDEAEAILSLKGSSGDLLISATTGVMTTQNLTWERFPFPLQLAVHGQAVTWQVELKGTLRDGSFVNVFWDDVTLSAEAATAAVPEPSSLVLLGTGALALLGCRARRRRNRDGFSAAENEPPCGP